MLEGLASFLRWGAGRAIATGLVSGLLSFGAHPGQGYGPLIFVAYAPLAWHWSSSSSSGQRLLAAALHGLTSWGLALLWLPAAFTAFSGADRLSGWVLWALVICGQTLVPLLAALSHSLVVGKLGPTSAFVLSMTAAGALVPVAIPYSPIAALYEHPLLLGPAWWGGRWCGAAFVFAANAWLGALAVLPSGAATPTWDPGRAEHPTPARVTTRRRALASLGGLGAFWLGLHFAQVTLLATPEREVRLLLVQPDISTGGSSASTARRLRQHVELTERALEGERPALVVWGETILGGPLAGHALSAPPGLEGALLRWDLPLLTGAVVRGIGPPFFNSVLLFPRGALSVCPTCRSDKRTLVPGAEFVPAFLAERGVSWPRGGKFSAGSARNLDIEGATLGPLICYEAIFAGAVLERAGSGADFLLNVVSDGWLPEEGRRAHRALATLAALESGRSLVRLAAGGPSTLTLPTGETRVLLAAGGAAARLVEVPLFTETTLLVRLFATLR